MPKALAVAGATWLAFGPAEGQSICQLVGKVVAASAVEMLMEAFCKHGHIDLASCPSYLTEELLIICSYHCQIDFIRASPGPRNQPCVVGQMHSDEVLVHHLT